VKTTAEYFQRAKEAEIRATEAKDQALKDQWRDLAIGYRNLAQARLIFITTVAPSQQPSALRASRASPRK
jgi:hypothetical protein